MGFFYSQLFITPKSPTNSFAGQTVIVTGANTGLGKEAARHLTRLGASKVIIACRNTNAGEEAKRDILSTTKVNVSIIEVWQLDLASYDSIKAFAERASQLPRIDVLLENAGIAAGSFKLIEGHESMVAINVISTFLLALLMLPKLKSTSRQFNTQPRLVIVSSEVHAQSKFQEWKASNTFDALDDQANTDMGERYPTSKLLEVLVIREIAPKLQGSGVILNMLNPGLCQSGLSRDTAFPVNMIMWLAKTILARTTEVGSRTLVAAAAAGAESHGKYMSDAKVEDESLSAFVKSEDGKKASSKVWSELQDILESIEHGVTRSV